MKSFLFFFGRIYEEIQKIEANEFHYQEQVRLSILHYCQPVSQQKLSIFVFLAIRTILKVDGYEYLCVDLVTCSVTFTD